METMTAFIFLGSKITEDCDCSQEIKTLAPWKKSYDKPRQRTKSRDITLSTKVHIVKAMVFPVVVYGFESSCSDVRCDVHLTCTSYEMWTIKKAEHQRMHAFKLWYWRRLLRVPWSARDQTNQS